MSNYRVIAIAGSLRTVSYTRYALAIALDAAAKLGADTELIDLKDYDLMFCEQYDNEEDFPDDVFRFRKKVAEADGIILGTPEYHGSFSGVLKNAIDLLGRNEFDNKLVGLIGVAGGSIGATNSLNGLRQVTRHLHAWTIPNHVSIPRASKKFDKEGNCLDESIEKRIREIGEIIVKYGKLHKMGHCED
ncbi:MAG: NAD(P)H-dependent oxidoreductase [Candidatus Heimdallarchaeota archaeon]|nr:NAD(P)H-dependent oxidoreductase [Candidatus Heimdallarchaeota archaeon]